jgi:CheY-like chemotaxis protein
MVRTFDILSAKVLIVDDQQAHVLLLERMLRGAGYTCVQSTTDPREVYDLHREHHFAVILLDLKMPGMDGFQVMESLKELETDDNLPVLVITAEPGEKLRALRAGARDFVSKPLDLAEVLMRLHNLIEVRLLRLERAQFDSQLVEVPL